MHYRRWRLYGDPHKTIGTPNELHGKHDTSEYRIWRHIKDRCLNPKNRRYSDYGGRGITVCDAWQHSFSAFLEDVGERPSNKHSIDRVDNDKGYSKENCRWATDQEQNLNKRVYKNSITGKRGIRKVASGKFSVRVSIGGSKQKSLGTFDTIDEAIRRRT